MSIVKQPGGQAAYKVVQPFIHEHVSLIVGVEVSLSDRQAQHLLLGGFIAVPVEEPPVAVVVTSEAGTTAVTAGKDGGKK